MRYPSVLSRAVQASSCVLVSLTMLLASCGGSGGDSSSPPPPLIQASLFSFPAGSEAPVNLPNALVSVTNASTGADITTASVTMNGQPLTYNGAPTHLAYEGTLAVNPGDHVSLVVNIGGSTYTASGTQATSYPTITAPASGDSWAAINTNTVTWSGGAPLTNAAYLVGVLDAADPAGGTPYFQAAATSASSVSIPANSLTVGSHVLIAGITTLSPISNAAPNSYFVLGGFNYVPITVYTWTPRTFGSGVIRSVAWSGTQFVAVGLVQFTGVVFTSPDGITWTSQTANAYSLHGITWSGTQFVAVGENGTVLTSADGITWTTRASGAFLYGIAWSGTNFAAVGYGGNIVTSLDGITWTPRTSGTANDLYAIAWSGTNFVAVGVGGTILTSSDGVTWTAATSGTTNGLLGIAWSGTSFAAVGEMGAILTSPDGVMWTTRTSAGITNPLYGIAWTGTRFMAVGYSGGIYTSPDGVTWTAQTSGTIFNLYSVVTSGAKIVAAGDSTILTSP